MSDLTINRVSPVIDFTSGDFDSLKKDLMTYAQAKYSDRWTNFNDDEFAVVMLDILCYLGDTLSYQIDSSIRELFAATVMREQNLRNIAAGFDYVPEGQFCAQGKLLVFMPDGVSLTTTLTDVFSNGASGDAEVVFSPTVARSYSYDPAGILIDVIEGEPYFNALIGVSNGNQNQRWQFPQENIVPSSVTVSVGAGTWTPTNNFTLTQSTSQVYKLIINDDRSMYVLFGDGTYGAIPATNAEIRATFRVGGGARGNLNPGALNKVSHSASPIQRVTNPSKMSGGADVPTIKQIKNAIPASLSTLDRAVTIPDYEALIALLPGVAKVRCAPGFPAGSRSVRAWVVMAGPAYPTAAQRTAISVAMSSKKMLTNRIRVFSPNFRDLHFEVLLHVKDAYRPSEVEESVRVGILNDAGTGLLNFNQLNFGAVTRTDDNEETLLLAQTALQGYFKSCESVGLERAEILRLDVTPIARARDEGNTGDGGVTSIITTSKQRRRQYSIEFVSAAQFNVFERIPGVVSKLTDFVLTDDNKIFENEGVADYTGFYLIPSLADSGRLPIVSVAGQDITVPSSSSLFSRTEPKAEYYIYNAAPTSLTIGQTFTSADGNVKFTVTNGATPFVAGDSFTLDIFPLVSDVRLQDDEYPTLAAANFVTRTSGGARL